MLSRVQYLLCTAVLCIVLSSVAAVAAPIEIELWGWLPGNATGDVLADIVNEFNASQSEVHVNVSQAQAGFDKWLVAFAGGAAPDITFNTADMTSAVGGENGTILALDKYIDGPNGFPRNVFIDDMWGLAVNEGKTYHIAIESNERGLFINTDLASRAGLNVKGSRTVRDWNDLLQWARKMTVRSGDTTTQWGFNVNHPLGGDRWHWTWLNDGGVITADGKDVKFDDPNTIEALQFAGDLIHSYQVSPPNHKGGNADPYVQGKYAMVMQTSQFISTLASRGIEEYMTVPGPVGVGKKGGRFSGASASAIAISKSCKHPDAAWKFVKWVTYDRGLKFTEARGGIPYLTKGLRSTKFQAHPWEAFATQILTFRPERIPYGLPADVWSTPFAEAWTAVMAGTKPAATALAEAAKTSRARLAEVNAAEK